MTDENSEMISNPILYVLVATTKPHIGYNHSTLLLGMETACLNLSPIILDVLVTSHNRWS